MSLRALWIPAFAGMTVKINSGKETELHHIDAVNQGLVAGQRVETTKKVRNKDFQERSGKFVGYVVAYVEIDGKEEVLALTHLEVGAKHPQGLKRGDRISVRWNSPKKKIRGKSGRFDRYADTIVDIGGFLHRPVVGSLKPVKQ